MSDRYRAPADGCTSYRALYRGLHQFETDLHQHLHLENNILFPGAMELRSQPSDRAIRSEVQFFSGPLLRAKPAADADFPA